MIIGRVEKQFVYDRFKSDIGMSLLAIFLVLNIFFHSTYLSLLCTALILLMSCSLMLLPTEKSKTLILSEIPFPG